MLDKKYRYATDQEKLAAYLIMGIVAVVTAMSFGASFWQSMGLAYLSICLAPEGIIAVE